MTAPIHRRTFLGSMLAALALGPDALAAAPGMPARPARACIVLYMRGGASQLETFDPKPGHPNGGGTETIATSVKGLRVAASLPRLARLARGYTLIRSMTGEERNHERARHLAHTSHLPAPGAEPPSLAAEVARARDSVPLPGSVAIGSQGFPAGMLGARFAPFAIPNALARVRHLTPPKRLAPERRRERLEVWRWKEQRYAAEVPEAQLDQRRAVWEQAIALMESKDARAFDLTLEPQKVRERYGIESRFGQGCLMARRLVQAGVPFVEVEMGGWDTHADNFERSAKLGADLDQGMASLLEDLKSSGLLDETLVLWIGDFGRTPRINARKGRDHFSRAYSAVVAGAGVPGGQVIGSTTNNGMEIVDRPVTVPDLLRTVAQRMGLDPDRQFRSRQGRPMTLIDGGEAVAELLG